MTIKTTEYNLLPVRRDGQQATASIIPTSAIAGGSGGGTALTGVYWSGTTLMIKGSIYVSGDSRSYGDVMAFSAASAPINWWQSMPVASASVLGGVKIGSGLAVSSGVISVTGGTGVSSWNDLSDKPSTFAPSAHGNSAHSEYYINSDELAIGLAGLVDSAPSTLNTLNELAAALGDDPNFATTVANNISTKAPLASPTFTGSVDIKTVAENNVYLNAGINSTYPSRTQLGIAAWSGYISLWDAGSVKDVHITADGNSYFNGGNVYVGKTSGNYNFEVNGDIGIIPSSWTSNSKATLYLGDQYGYLRNTWGGAGELNMYHGTWIKNIAGEVALLGINDTTTSVFYGNVGIGTASPAAKLVVKPETDVNLYFGSLSGKGRIGVVNDAATDYSCLEMYAKAFNYNDGVFFIDTVGNKVGVGTTSPASKLDVNGTVTASNYLYSNSWRTQKEHSAGATVAGAGWYKIAHLNTDRGQQQVTIWTTGSNWIPLGTTIRWGEGWDFAGITVISETGSNDYWRYARITRNANSTDYFLEVYFTQPTDFNLTIQYFGAYDNGDIYSGSIPATSNETIIYAETIISGLQNLNGKFSVDISGNVCTVGEVTAYSSSDERLKQNIKPLKSGLELIHQLQPVTYNWNEKAVELSSWKNTYTNQFGLVAQEVQKVLPEIVHTIYDEYKSLDYQQLIAVLIQGMKEQQKQIQCLQQDLNYFMNSGL